jgi:hypothetical protein
MSSISPVGNVVQQIHIHNGVVTEVHGDVNNVNNYYITAEHSGTGERIHHLYLAKAMLTIYIDTLVQQDRLSYYDLSRPLVLLSTL